VSSLWWYGGGVWYRCESRARSLSEHIVLLCMTVCVCVRARTHGLATWSAGPAWTHTHTHRDVLESLGRWANSAAGPPPPMPSWLRWWCAAGGGPAARDARDPNRRPSRPNVWIFFFRYFFCRLLFFFHRFVMETSIFLFIFFISHRHRNIFRAPRPRTGMQWPLSVNILWIHEVMWKNTKIQNNNNIINIIIILNILHNVYNIIDYAVLKLHRSTNLRVDRLRIILCTNIVPACRLLHIVV